MAHHSLTINAHGRLLSLEQPRVMGILNVTPDSFFAGSRKQSEYEIAQRAEQIVAEGGDMIDIGAFSTRPGAEVVALDEEARRLEVALRIVRRLMPEVIISVDTYRPLLARRCVEDWGADIINDVSEGGVTGIVGQAIQEEGDMFETVAALKVPYVLMSVQGNVQTMMLSFAEKVQKLHDLGVNDVILDPGFGFGKTLGENYRLLGQLDVLGQVGLPVLVGVSRKSMISKVLETDAGGSLNGTTAVHMLALMKGAGILRAHDVREAVETIRIFQAFQRERI